MVGSLVYWVLPSFLGCPLLARDSTGFLPSFLCLFIVGSSVDWVLLNFLGFPLLARSLTGLYLVFFDCP